MELPAGYREHDIAGVTVVARSAATELCRRALGEAGSLYRWAARQPEARVLRGRGATYALHTEVGEWVVRHAWRGGAIAHVLRDLYVRSGEPRPYAELRVSQGLR
ncbi:MAG: lipopolysaccharide kinase InaA family protein, partial [Longimicrobiales bacterium]